jgi:Acyl-CoA synthetases (AMP-forming)/AMP-acid ligases II
MENYNLAAAFHRMAVEHPERLAISAGRAEVSYGALADRAAALAAHVGSEGKSVRVGILASRSIEAYTGILGAAWAGGTYIPLNLKWPEARLVALLDALALDALVVDAVGVQLLTPAVLAHAPAKIVLPAGAQIAAPDGIAATSVDTLPSSDISPRRVGPDHLAYVIFTSGTTGMPKGVMISAGSLRSYLDSTRGWTCFTPEDRIAETCDVTFDLTVHNMYLCFEAGASLHLMSQLEMLGPQHFIRSRRITAWMSVPTVLSLMARTGALKPGIFPSLRLSVFCGEPLPLAGVMAWRAAAPNSTVENIYGPTEVTVICLRQTVTGDPAVTPGRDIIAIGKPYDTMEVAILDAEQRRLPDGAPGEIAMRGPQVGIGYFNAPEQTADRFRVIDGERWYLTGDLGYRDPDGTFHHLGRVDNQVKVKGNRIELEEVEAHLRRAGGTDLVAAVAWPVAFGSAEGLVGFLAGTGLGPTEIINDMLKSLPRYMVPTEIRVVDELPRNVNGKIDRRALFERLEKAAAGEETKERSIA